MSLTNSVFKASIWSSVTELAAKVISPLVFLILTRILSPKDFGIVAVATTLLSFIYIISDLGTSKLIIQTKTEGDEFRKVCDVAFCVNLAIGIVFFLLVFFFSYEISLLFNQPEADLVVKVMSIQILAYSLSSIQNAIRRRELDFKFLFYTRMITVGAPAIISVPIALFGGGVWAIVLGSVAGSVMNTIVLWSKNDWKPSVYFNYDIFKYIFSNSIWNSLEEFFIWIPIFMDTYLLSNFFGSLELGLFTTSKTIYLTLNGLLLAPLMPVLFSAFSRISENNQKFRDTILLSHKIVFSISAISCAVGYLYSDVIEKVLFTSEWIGIAKMLKWTFLLMGCTFFNEVISQALKSRGYFRIVALNTIVTTLISIPILYYSIELGIVTYVIIRYSLLYLRFPLIFVESNLKLGISFTKCINQVKYILIVVMLMLLYPILICNFNLSFWNEVILRSVFVIVLLGTLIYIEKNTLLNLYYNFKKR